jgi:hypothetical protein
MSTNNIYSYSKLLINKHSTVIIVDWDDTLFPTSWATSNNISLNDPNDRSSYCTLFSELDKTISSLLKEMKKMGTVVIITNASLKWIDMTLTVLPITTDTLKDIEVVSARHLYQDKVNVNDWKKYTFIDKLNHIINTMPSSCNNIISLGDADYEYYALLNIYGWRRVLHKYLKSIKFIKTPNYDDLIDQMKLTKQHFHRIWSSPRQIDLKFD